MDNSSTHPCETLACYFCTFFVIMNIGAEVDNMRHYVMAVCRCVSRCDMRRESCRYRTDSPGKKQLSRVFPTDELKIHPDRLLSALPSLSY